MSFGWKSTFSMLGMFSIFPSTKGKWNTWVQAFICLWWFDHFRFLEAEVVLQGINKSKSINLEISLVEPCSSRAGAMWLQFAMKNIKIFKQPNSIEAMEAVEAVPSYLLTTGAVLSCIVATWAVPSVSLATGAAPSYLLTTEAVPFFPLATGAVPSCIVAAWAVGQMLPFMNLNSFLSHFPGANFAFSKKPVYRNTHKNIPCPVYIDCNCSSIPLW